MAFFLPWNMKGDVLQNVQAAHVRTVSCVEKISLDIFTMLIMIKKYILSVNQETNVIKESQIDQKIFQHISWRLH